VHFVRLATTLLKDEESAQDNLILACILYSPVPILSVLPALIVHSELKSVHPGFPVAFIFKHKLINK